jgi:hypothetical protein
MTELEDTRANMRHRIWNDHLAPDIAQSEKTITDRNVPGLAD